MTEPIDLDAIKAREQKATKGPWTFRVVKKGQTSDGSMMIGAVAPGHQIRTMAPGGSYPSNDGDFIAHARDDIPNLVATVERLQVEVAELRRELALERCPFGSDDIDECGCYSHTALRASRDKPCMGVSDVTEPIDRLRALTFTEFSAANRQRCEAPDGFKHALHSWSTSDWFLAVFGELGEAANIAKKLNRVRDGIPGNKESADALRDKLRREIGDAFVYLDLLAQSLGVDIGAAAVEVFNAKSVEIGYPHALSAVPRALGGGEAQRPQARTLRERATMNILTVMEPWPDSTKKITRQLLSALERAEREIESLSVAASLPGGGITPPTEQPADAQGRLMLNAYGRQCYDLGFAAGADSHSITPPDQPGEQANGD